MSTEPILIFDNVWKRFRRGQVHDSLRELIPAVARKLSGRSRPELEARDFWALSDLSFEVKPGEVLGIIGTNGAGKSTTLKILNQLMEPTKGAVYTRGKIGSLIEVSAGFHQDLSGRQNVFLQGAIMGMSKAEVTRKFEQIVEFSGIADFIDTPVKRYSSGMNARLGFSIAVHLEPEILIIDEVLAVGDHAFQQRAFGKIKGLATNGAPVVLVSHQLDRIAELCTKVILLDKGSIKASGSAAHCINEYLHPPQSDQSNLRGKEVGIQFDEMRTEGGLAANSGDEVVVVLKGETTRRDIPDKWQIAFRVIDSSSGHNVHSVIASQRDISMPQGKKFHYRLGLQLNLAEGNYFVEAVIWDTERNADVLVGPRVNIEVLPSLAFYGSAQLNSRWQTVETFIDSDTAVGQRT